jgi:hypothetical protein
MRYKTGDLVYIRGLKSAGKLPIVGLEYEWQGCVERLAYCKLKSRAGIIRIRVENILSTGEAVAERLKGCQDGHILGI